MRMMIDRKRWRPPLTLTLTPALLGAALAIALGFALAPPASAAGGETETPRRDWTFAGMFGHYDRAQLRRGFTVYREVCSACHGLRLLHYRNLSEPGGPELSNKEVKEIAAGVEITDGPNDEGEMFTRPGKPSDAFKSPFKNAQEARTASNGALPPDLSVIAKGREAVRHTPWFLEPLKWVREVAAGYQEGGPDYIYALMTGYEEVPQWLRKPNGHWVRLAKGESNDKAKGCVSVARSASGEEKCVPFGDGMSYNVTFPGHQIAMPPPLSDEMVEYTDGTPQTVTHYVEDVTSFLMWAAEPKLEERKRLGLRVLIYLAILAALLYATKRKLWSRLEH